ncbi:MAG: SMI1/KNR4 family protein [Anaerolineae bacterium]|nr:SMI1/KNR4 family protein [Anaerolineae bacterium]
MRETDLWAMLNELLEDGVIDIVGDALSPPTAERKAEVAELVPRPMPESLQTLLAAAHGACVGSINLFTLDELEDVHHAQDYLFTYLPSVIYFASDGGDGFFFMDPDDGLGQGTEAIFWVYRGSAVPNESVFYGRDLGAFLISLAQDEEVWDASSLEQAAISRMLAALDARQDRWSDAPGARLGDVLDIADREGLRAPKCLEKLLRKSNGLVFPGTGVTVWATSTIKRVEATFSDGYQPLALLMGEDKAGNTVAITHRDHPSHVPAGWPLP